MKRILVIVALMAGWLGMAAQTADYRFVKRSDPWLTGQNAAALTRFMCQTESDNADSLHSSYIAEAELSLTKAKGGFTNFDGSPNVLQGDASVESFFRLNPQVVVFGAMSYSNFSGKDMAGSAFIGSHRPFDLVEDSLMNTGTKHLDVYRLSGGFGYDVTDGFAVGARLDYTAANYAKYKDLRHQNKLMDLQLTTGIYVPVASWLQVGAHYLYHRNTESVLFSTFGKTDKVYKTLIDYANFTGQVEQFGGDGFTDKSREMPLVNDYNGLGIQFSVGAGPVPARSGPVLSFYNAFHYAKRRGYYGRKSPYTITYTNHESHCYSYDARLTHEMKRMRHYLELHLQAENLQNDGATYREQQNESGASHYEYYTPVKTANKLWVEGSVAYTADIFHRRVVGHASQRGSSEELPRWEAWPTMTVQMGLNWQHRKQTAYLYPYARRQRLTVYEPFVFVCRNIVAAKSEAVWSFALDASFRKGTGEPYEDFTLNSRQSDLSTSTNGGDSGLPTMYAYLWREYRWLTAAQYQIGGSVKYAFPLKSSIFRSALPLGSSKNLHSSPLRPYVKASLSHHKANGGSALQRLETLPEYKTGNDRTTATIALGCNF